MGKLQTHQETVSKNKVEAQKMAQQVKAPAIEPDNLSMIPGTHMVEGEMTPTIQAVL